MNITRDTAIWAASLLPSTAPEWLVGITVIAGIALALAAAVAPPCIIYAAVTRWKERHHERT